MSYIGYVPAAKPLTSADITDSIITSAKIVDGTIAIADLSATGSPGSTTFLRGDNTWGSAGATAGQVIQVIQATDQTTRNTTSTSFVTASNTLSVTITPSSASNKILILLDAMGRCGDANVFFCTIYRNGTTNLGNSSGGFVGLDAGSDGLSDGSGTCSATYLDSPSTTSATTYQAYIRVNGSYGGLNYSSTAGVNCLSTITVMEIKG